MGELISSTLALWKGNVTYLIGLWQKYHNEPPRHCSEQMVVHQSFPLTSFLAFQLWRQKSASAESRRRAVVFRFLEEGTQVSLLYSNVLMYALCSWKRQMKLFDLHSFFFLLFCWRYFNDLAFVWGGQPASLGLPASIASLLLIKSP